MVIWLCPISLTPLNPMQKSNRKSNYLLLCTSFLHSATTFKFITLAYLLFRNSLSKKFILPWCHRPTRPILCFSLINWPRKRPILWTLKIHRKLTKIAISIFFSVMINKETLQNYIIYTTHITILNLQTIF